MWIAKSRLFLFISVALALSASAAWADSMASLMGYPYGPAAGPGFAYATMQQQGTNGIARRINSLVYPVLGFPEIVQTGDELNVVVYYPNGDDYPLPEDWQVRLTTGFTNPAANSTHVGDPVAQNYDLVPDKIVYDSTNHLYALSCLVPDGIPADVFGLAIVAETIVDYQRAAVAVKDQIGATYVFAHIADFQADDSAAASTKNELNNHSYPGSGTEPRTYALLQNEFWSELALLRPEFAVVAGDLTSGTSYNQQNAAIATIMENTKVPLFMTAGNHDGYAYFDGTSLADDGLEYFARDFGPLYYSFDYGSLHFTVVNSMDGSTQRREGHNLFSIGTEANNYGGFLSQTQAVWLDHDLAAAAKAGKSTLLFMHQDPRGPYVADKPPPEALQQMMFWNYDSSAWDSDPNDDISNETPQDNQGVKLVATALQNQVTYLFLAHAHVDDMWSYQTGQAILDRDGTQVGSLTAPRPFAVVQTTSAAAAVGTVTGQTEYNGYRLIQVKDGAVEETNAFDPTQPSRSVPAGNFWFTTTNNDGASTSAQIDVVNGLAGTIPVTLQFFMAPHAAGYQVVNAQTGDPVSITAVGLGENGGAVLYAKATAAGVTTFPAAPGGETTTRFAANPNPTNQPPTATFAMTPTNDERTFHFDASGSTHAGGGPLSYFWDFGDGLTGVGKTIDHVFLRSGKSVITLTAMDQFGGVGVSQATLAAAASGKSSKHLGCGQCDVTPGASPWPSIVMMLLAALGVALLRFVLAEKRSR